MDRDRLAAIWLSLKLADAPTPLSESLDDGPLGQRARRWWDDSALLESTPAGASLPGGVRLHLMQNLLFWALGDVTLAARCPFVLPEFLNGLDGTRASGLSHAYATRFRRPELVLAIAEAAFRLAPHVPADCPEALRCGLAAAEKALRAAPQSPAHACDALRASHPLLAPRAMSPLLREGLGTLAEQDGIADLDWIG